MAGRPSQGGGSGGSELERLRTTVARYFPVYESRVTPQSLLLAVHVQKETLPEKFDQLRRELGPLGYAPILRRDHGEDFVEVVRRPRLGGRHPWINVVLLAATIATTTFAGAMIWLAYVGQLVLGPADFVYGFLYFGGPLLAILGLHETAHYVVARRRHLDASLPYFIPIPPPYLLGTFGAFVSMREPFPDRKALFDIGVAGPIAGFAVSIPVVLGGLALSAHAPVLPSTYCGPTLLGQSYGNLILGPSLLWQGLALFFPTGFSNLHPLALAGWVGILVTAMNLIPAGSLDGGHVFRAVLGERARYVSYLAALALFGMGLFYFGWVFFGFIVLLLGLRHPPPLNDATPLDAKRYALGIFAAGILVTGFVLVPLSTPLGDVGLTNAGAAPWHPPPAGAAVAANLTATAHNKDPTSHAFVFAVTITNVSVATANGTRFLTGAALAAWEANATWKFLFPGNVTVGTFTGGAASVPADQSVTVAGGGSLPVVVQLTSPSAAVTATVDFQASILCPPSGAGSAGTSLLVVF